MTHFFFDNINMYILIKRIEASEPVTMVKVLKACNLSVHGTIKQIICFINQMSNKNRLIRGCLFRYRTSLHVYQDSLLDVSLH